MWAGLTSDQLRAISLCEQCCLMLSISNGGKIKNTTNNTATKLYN